MFSAFITCKVSPARRGLLNGEFLADDDFRGRHDLADRRRKNAEIVVIVADAAGIAVLEQQLRAIRSDVEGIAAPTHEPLAVRLGNHIDIDEATMTLAAIDAKSKPWCAPDMNAFQSHVRGIMDFKQSARTVAMGDSARGTLKAVFPGMMVSAMALLNVPSP